MEFPRLVYKSASAHRVAETQEEFDQLCVGGWFASVPEAIEGKSSEAKAAEQAKHEAEAKAKAEAEANNLQRPPTRAELEAKAAELGIQFDGRIGDKKLGQLIEDALKA